MKNNYLQYTFVVPENTDKDVLTALLSDYDFEGFVETDNGFLAYIPESKDNSEWLELLQNIDENITFNKEKIEDKNWNEEWEKNYDIAVINEQCEIYAPFHNVNPNILYPIFIEPKMSFGTGHHSTTFMMGNILFDLKNFLQNKTIIDVGCGTGILGIIAKKLGAGKIFAIDNDPVCIENTLENIQKNFSATEVDDFTIMLSDIQNFTQHFPQQKFDVIIANIQKNVILQDMPVYQKTLNTNGYLLISGILKEQEKEIIEAANKLQHITTHYKQEWCAIIFKN